MDRAAAVEQLSTLYVGRYGVVEVRDADHAIVIYVDGDLRSAEVFVPDSFGGLDVHIVSNRPLESGFAVTAAGGGKLSEANAKGVARGVASSMRVEMGAAKAVGIGLMNLIDSVAVQARALGCTPAGLTIAGDEAHRRDNPPGSAPKLLSKKVKTKVER